jgi:hypothetical protein
MAMSALESASNTEAGTSASATASTTSPTTYRSAMMQSQPFNIESFDFGADFSLPTSIDELALFQQQQQQEQQRSLTNPQSAGGPSSNNGMTESPHNLDFSPRNAIGNQQHLQGGSTSRTASPHTFSARGDDAASVSSGGSINNFSNVDLNNLLRAVQASSSSLSNTATGQTPFSATHEQNQTNIDTNANMSLSEMETYLLEKEQAERMQILQTALLRQQLESLQRQHSSQSTDSNQSSVPSARTSQMMHQFQQLTSQQNASTPTPQSMQSAFPQQSQQGGSNAALAFQPQKIDLTALSQYGLVTPLSSNGFVQNHQGPLPFVSPIHLPNSSQQGLMDGGHRSYDHTYTPLESPAITPASVFSNIGSGNTTSQDMFSPLTSPALRPQVGNTSEEYMLPLASPFLGPNMSRGPSQVRGKNKKSTTPGVSPAVGPTKSVPRKNRSTTAEARANRARPSPLVKPTAAGANLTSATSSRRRNDSTGLASPLAMAILNGAVNSPKKVTRKSSQSEAGKSNAAFPPLHAGTSSSKPLGASPSDEGASTTPSPIDLDGSSSKKPMTPGSIMGIDAKNSQKAKTRSSDNGKQVSFATNQAAGSSASPGPLQNILPGGDGWGKASGSGSSGSGGGGGGIESRRTSHKAAEQKRRDSLKYCFDELRNMLPAITLDDEAPGGSSLGPDGFTEDQEDEDFDIEDVGDEEEARHANRAISKVALLRHSNEYIIRLKQRLARRDRDLEFCRKQVVELRSRLGYPIESQEGGILAQYMQPFNMDTTHFAAHNGAHDYNTIGSNQMDIS